jgi:hypothetical protein
MSHLQIQYEKLIEQGFDQLGAIVMVIDGHPGDERYEPTIELLEAIGYQRADHDSVESGEYAIKTVSGRADATALPSFFVKFMIGKQLFQYQPLNRFIARGKSCLPHRPESDFRFADWYPAKRVSGVKRKKRIEDQIADDFPNAAAAAQFLHEQGLQRSNTYKKLDCSTYFVAARHGDGQPSGIVFRGDGETFFYDFYSDDRYVMGASGVLKDHQPTERQLTDSLSLATMNLPI